MTDRFDEVTERVPNGAGHSTQHGRGVHRGAGLQCRGEVCPGIAKSPGLFGVV